MENTGENTNLALRYNTDKTQLSYILDFSNAVEGVCRVAMFGAHKYERDNWRKGRPYKDTIDSLLRHLGAFQNGADYDADSGLPHVDHVAWNALALAEFFRTHPELDDRYKENNDV